MINMGYIKQIEELQNRKQEMLKKWGEFVKILFEKPSPDFPAIQVIKPK